MKPSAVYAALFAVQVIFATLPVALKVALRDLSSPALALLRVAGAALLFVAIHRLTVRERVRGWRDYAWLAVYAVFGVILNQILYITALTLTTATAAQMMMTAGPAVTLLTAILLRKETATAPKWMGIALAGSGAVYLVGAGAGAGAGNWLGNLLALLNVSAYSIYLVISRDMLRRYDALTVVTWIFVWGAAGIAPWGIGPAAAQAGGMSGATWAALAWIILLPTVGAYWLNVVALKHAEASVVSAFVYLQPVLTALIAVPVLHERLSPRMLPAAALIFAGVGVIVWEGRRERARRAALASDGSSGV